MNTMHYDGYIARIEYSEKDNLFWGKLAGIKDSVTFHGNSAVELRAAFKEAVDDYLAWCEEEGKEPQKPKSGNILLRLPPETHTMAAIQAEARGMSLNQWLAGVIAHACSD